ncbi:MAG: glycosyltransferase [Candidatus Thermoplasmatota archaeon]
MEMRTLPRVSVIMSSYNHLPYIRTAIESVLSQSVRGLELLIVDDGSQDGSRELIEQAVAWDDRIRAVFHTNNLGIARTLNDGMKNADGEFLAFIASDDVWKSDKLEKQLAVLESDDTLIVWSEGEIIDAAGKLTGQTFTRIHNSQGKPKSGRIFEDLLKGNFIFGSSRILKRESALSVMYDEELKFLNDYKFELSLARRHSYYFLEEPLAYYRLHGQNTVSRDGLSWLSDGVKLKEWLLKECKNEISREEIARIHAEIGGGCLRLGNRRKAFYEICEALKLDPMAMPIHIPKIIVGLAGKIR